MRLELVRAEAVHRDGDYGEALEILERLRRDVDDAPGGKPEPSISMLAARIHAWRPNMEAASFEVMRAVAEAELLNQPDTLAKALSVGAEVALEASRHATALALIELARTHGQLTAAEVQRLDWRMAICLNRLGRHSDAIDILDEADALPGRSERLRHVQGLERARAMAGMDGRKHDAVALLDRLRAQLSDEPDSYERIEWHQAHGQIMRFDDPGAAIDSLTIAIDRFERDGLNTKRVEALLHLADCHRQRGDQPAWSNALTNAARAIYEHGLDALRDDLMGAAFRFDGAEQTQTSLIETMRGRRATRYLRGDRIGAGGSGTVYRGVDLSDGSSCAYKVLHMSGKGTLSQAMLGEFAAAARLRHPNLLTIRDLCQIDNELVLISDLIEGQQLDACGFEAYTRSEQAHVMLQLIDAIMQIHAAGLVHRDIKPANVLMADRYHPVLIDFGIARLIAENGSAAGIAGTPRYMAPELKNAQTAAGAGPAGDVFALGVMIRDDTELASAGAMKRLFARVSTSDALSAMTSPDPTRRPTLNAVRDALGALL